ncbi:SMI1/KNR4 family protein [Paraflavitalea sp. CAU 1676]|uniref:SMI1/KNR4 family protein n=1 Tax=Paraflavitalea sp. CAU 1676 TaxID=3032598 RepID=UPI0023D9E2E5|nr:SMI1/KNR4 family protein [Paraflavitalea sp. CAU 1676]MDF2188213.1 hypothetical protein [Paraflavitalea sp. CAU 1676]
MARYYGPVKIRGSVGGLTYYENEEGQFVKEKGSPRECRMQYGEEFMRSRRYAAEFQGATAVARQLRDAMGNLTIGVRSMRASSNMTTWLLSVAHTDPVSDWGERKVWLGDLSLLQGYEFNKNNKLDDALPVPLWDNCRLVDGKATVKLPGFRLRRKKNLPDNASHFRMVSAVLYLDAGKKTYKRDLKEGTLCEIGNKAGPAFEAEHEIAAGEGQLVLWLVGIEYLGMGKKRMEVLKGGAMRVMGCGLGGLVDYERLGEDVESVGEVRGERVVERRDEDVVDSEALAASMNSQINEADLNRSSSTSECKHCNMISENLGTTIQKVSSYWESQGIKLEVVPPQAIVNTIQENGLSVPDDFKHFYSVVNGMPFWPGYSETDENCFLFYELKQITTLEKDLNRISCLPEKDNVYVFADYMTRSWWYGYRYINEREYVIGIIPYHDTFTPITNSLEEFLQLYLEDSERLYQY